MRSFPFRETSGHELPSAIQDIAARLARRPPSWVDRELLSFLESQQTVWVHDGDVVIDGSFQPPYPSVLIAGDLVVSGSVFTGFRGGPSSTFLLVTGEVRCSSLLVEHEATTVIAGGLVAREAILAHKAADSATYVGRHCQAACIVEGNGCDVRVGDAVVSVGVRVADGAAAMWKTFPPELLTFATSQEDVLRREEEGEDVGDDVDLDLVAIKRRLRNNESLNLRHVQ